MTASTPSTPRSTGPSTATGAGALPHPPRAVEPDALLASLRARYACKQFDPSRRIADADWRALEQALLLSPSSFGLQPWRFVVVQDPVLRERLVPVSWGQRQLVDASHVVVFAARRGMGLAEVDRHLRRIAELRGVPPESLAGYRQKMEPFVQPARAAADVDAWCARQTYIALGVFLASAALLGLDACPMEGIEPARYDEILGLPARGYGALCAAAVGYRAPTDTYQHATKVRFDMEDVIERR
jgi:nitroreductase